MQTKTYDDVLLNMEREKIMFELSLIDSPEEVIYDNITQLVSKIMGTPISLVTLVTSKHGFFKSHFGLPEDIKKGRRAPLSHSLCKHVVRDNAPLIVSDARQHPRVKNNGAVLDLNVVGYLGIPLTLSDGSPLGSFCAIDMEVHDWSQTEIDIMTELAGIVSKEFDARAFVRLKKLSKDELRDLQERIIAFADAINTEQSQASILEDIRAKREEYDLL